MRGTNSTRRAKPEPPAQEVDYNTSCEPGYKFAGMEYDSETGNYYDHARYYNPRLGRFMTPDPSNAGAVAGNPQSWNAYSYVLNNPETLIDPTGACAYTVFQDGESPCIVDTLFTTVRVSGVSPMFALVKLALGFSQLQGPTIPKEITGLPLNYHGGSLMTQQPGSHSCSGSVRVMKGNAKKIGQPGGFSGNTPKKFVYVTAGGAAVVPSQWGGKGELRPYLNQISGVFPEAGVSFQGVVDVIGSTTVPHVRSVLMKRYPGDLIVELPGASKDYRVTPGVLTMPTAQPCPQGTTQVP